MIPIFTVAVGDAYAYQAACLAATCIRFGCKPKIFIAKLSPAIEELLEEVSDELIEWNFPENREPNGAMKAYLGGELAKYPTGLIVDADAAFVSDPHGRRGPIDFIRTLPGLYCDLNCHATFGPPRSEAYASLAGDARAVGGAIGWNGRRGAQALRIWQEVFTRETGQQFWDDEISLGYVWERYPELIIAPVRFNYREKATYAPGSATGSPKDIESTWVFAATAEVNDECYGRPPWLVWPYDGHVNKWPASEELFKLFDPHTTVPLRMARILGTPPSKPEVRRTAGDWIARATTLQNAFEDAGVPCVICGSVALAMQGWKIPINDLDLMVPANSELMARAFAILRRYGWECTPEDAERCVRLGTAQHRRGPYAVDICTGRTMSGLRRRESIEKYVIIHKGRRIMRSEGVFLTRCCRGRNADHTLWEHATPPVRGTAT